MFSHNRNPIKVYSAFVVPPGDKGRAMVSDPGSLNASGLLSWEGGPSESGSELLRVSRLAGF